MPGAAPRFSPPTNGPSGSDRRIERLRASPFAPRAARRIVGARPQLAPYPDLRFAAQLLASELVSNAVRHAGVSADHAIGLCVEITDGAVHVQVRDRGSGFDPLARIAEHRRHGDRHRGLVLVDALADRWGFRRGTNEYRVWFELDLLPGRRPWRGREAIP